MKRPIFITLSCVIFVLSVSMIFSLFGRNYICVMAAQIEKTSDDFLNEEIEFTYQGRVFSYRLSDNIKNSNIFDINYTINKYHRFSSHTERKALLQHMLEVGIDREVALFYLFPNLDRLIDRIEKNIFVKSQDAKLRVDTATSKVFFITPEVTGVSLNRDKLYDTIIENYLSDKSLKFTPPVTINNATITSRDLERFTNLRSDFATDISKSSADRKHNVKTALASLNKIEIMPNQVFSFNRTVGQRTSENGYREAKIIVNNEFVDGLGGGVCQVSTTLYNAALLAGLDIVEANKHSKQVHYVKYGFDAMVNFGSSDLKFRNNTGEKITIITNYTGDKARIRIFGEKLAGVTYRLTNEISNIVEPTVEVKYDESGEYLDRVEYEDESFILKNSTRGMDIKSYREKYVNGERTTRELLRTDRYKAQNAVRVYGTKKRTDSLCVLDMLGV